MSLLVVVVGPISSRLHTIGLQVVIDHFTKLSIC